MHPLIRHLRDTDIEAVVQLSLLAWAPIFDSWARILGPDIYPVVFPDWRQSQSEGVEKACRDPENTVWVAEVEGVVAGFLVYKLNHKDKIGEVQYLAVHPEYQGRGIGTELNNWALQKMRESGMKVATVGTGGDPAHAAARRAYEKAGYSAAIPGVHYYQAL